MTSTEGSVRAGSGATTLRLASLPSVHPFVDSFFHGAPDCERITVVEPRGDAATPLHGLVPPLGKLDGLVVNFGLEGHPTADVRRLLRDADRAGCVVAAVVHDLDNPHLPAAHQGRHRRQTRLVLDAAVAVATLSQHARQRLRDRAGVEALVLPHPPLGPRGPVVRRPPADRVLVHLKSLRRNLLVGPALDAMTRLANAGAATPIVRLHRRVRVGRSMQRALRAASHAGVTVRRHQPLGHDELVAALVSTDVLVLPYSHGTHSGLLDLARDLGTRVVAPAVGAYREQGATATFRPRAGDVAGSIVGAVDRALRAPAPGPRCVARRAERFDAVRDLFVDRVRSSATVGVGA